MKTSSISATTRSRRLVRLAGGVAFALVAATAALHVPVQAHHSFSIFDTSKTRVFTGVVTRVNPDVNHLQIFFAVMNDERTNVNRDAKNQPIVWAVEMAGSAQAAQQGISVNAFTPGTIISLALHPLRDGQPAGNREGAMFKCPAKTPPKPGKHCDSVEGSQTFGTGPLPTPTS
jgi:hypothetical protein